MAAGPLESGASLQRELILVPARECVTARLEASSITIIIIDIWRLLLDFIGSTANAPNTITLRH